jgi:hypothetical protein
MSYSEFCRKLSVLQVVQIIVTGSCLLFAGVRASYFFISQQFFYHWTKESYLFATAWMNDTRYNEVMERSATGTVGTVR